MSDRISTKAGVFESGEKDAMGVQYKEGRLIACRNPKLTEYAVAEGTEVICDRAFINMRELRSVRLPGSLKAIGESAFSGCKALADINIPEGVTEIRQATFRDCDALVAIELPASVTEIEKFAFGRGLTTLVVNASEMKIDRYAFMNSRDFSTLIVPAGRGDYYRAQLADMRVNAEVEEVETEDNELRPMLDKFACANADEENEMTKGSFKSNNMDKKLVEISGVGYTLRFYDENGNLTESISQYAEREGLKLKVDDKEYTDSQLADVFFDLPGSLQSIVEEFQEGKDCYIKEFCNDKGASSVARCKKSETTTIEIEIPTGEQFDSQKAAIVTAAWVYPDNIISHMVVGLLYENKVYPLYPDEVDTPECETTCIYNTDKTESGVEYTPETATDEQLADATKLPVLIFRYQTLSYCFSPGDEFDAEEYSDLEGPGVVSAINDEGNGTMFICADSIEYINSGEMTEILMEKGITKYEITLSATEKKYVLLNTDSKPDRTRMLETIATIWEPSNENCNYIPVFDKLLFRAICRDPEDCAQNYDYLLDNGKIYELPEGKFDEIVTALSAEDQALYQDITPFDEYEEK